MLRFLLPTSACFLLLSFFSTGVSQRNVGNLKEGKQMVEIPAGDYTPFYLASGEKSKKKVEAFYLDVYSVTNEEFLQFVKSNPNWCKSRVKRLFADSNYLKHWASDLIIGKNYDQIKNSPVTNISWFAANAYSHWVGKRLPTLVEWEYAANSNPDTTNDLKNKTALIKFILQWYDKPNPRITPNVGSTFKNKYGLFDMHGLVWEWVYDFNNRTAGSDARNGNDPSSGLFCSDGTLKSANKEDYATYMRYAFRYSLKGNYCIGNLGFRCAKNNKI